MTEQLVNQSEDLAEIIDTIKNGQTGSLIEKL